MAAAASPSLASIPRRLATPEENARRTLGGGAALVALGLAVVGVDSSEEGTVITLVGLFIVIYGIHAFGRLGPEDAGERKARRRSTIEVPADRSKLSEADLHALRDTLRQRRNAAILATLAGVAILGGSYYVAASERFLLAWGAIVVGALVAIRAQGGLQALARLERSREG